MSKNPFINAISALVYIVLVVSVMDYLSHHAPQKSTIVVPIAVLSLFTLSAATMGYLFLSMPLHLYLDGKKKEGLRLFGQTIAVFAGLTVIVLTILFFGLHR